jgi:hypothetical protein
MVGGLAPLHSLCTQCGIPNRPEMLKRNIAYSEIITTFLLVLIFFPSSNKKGNLTLETLLLTHLKY